METLVVTQLYNFVQDAKLTTLIVPHSPRYPLALF